MTTPDLNEGLSRVCRRCSVASTGGGDFCPSCGTSYVRRSRVPSRRIAERSSRRELVTELEGRITKHAKKLVKDDLLEGPIMSSSCTATGGGSSDDLTALTGTFECLAVNTQNDDGTMSGYSYAGTIEWATGGLTWQLSS